MNKEIITKVFKENQTSFIINLLSSYSHEITVITSLSVKKEYCIITFDGRHRLNSQVKIKTSDFINWIKPIIKMEA